MKCFAWWVIVLWCVSWFLRVWTKCAINKIGWCWFRGLPYHSERKIVKEFTFDCSRFYESARRYKTHNPIKGCNDSILLSYNSFAIFLEHKRQIFTVIYVLENRTRLYFPSDYLVWITMLQRTDPIVVLLISSRSSVHRISNSIYIAAFTPYIHTFEPCVLILVPLKHICTQYGYEKALLFLLILLPLLNAESPFSEAVNIGIYLRYSIHTAAQCSVFGNLFSATHFPPLPTFPKLSWSILHEWFPLRSAALLSIMNLPRIWSHFSPMLFSSALIVFFEWVPPFLSCA